MKESEGHDMWAIKKYAVQIIETFLFVAVLVVAGLNIFVFKTTDFWEINIFQVITLFVAIMLAFWATQRKSDERQIKEQIEKITEKIQSEVSSSSFVVFKSTDDSTEVQKRITMTPRKLTNCISVLKEYSTKIDIMEDVKYIEEQVRGYRDFVSVHVGDLEYLSKSETDLRRYADNISSKCDSIVLKLYKGK